MAKGINKDYAVIRLNEDPTGIEPEVVPVNINGERIRIKRNEYVPVKSSVISVLRNALRPVYAKPKGESTMVRNRKPVSHAMRFPFETTGYISEEAYKYLRSIATQRSITESEIDAAISGDFALEVA